MLCSKLMQACGRILLIGCFSAIDASTPLSAAEVTAKLRTQPSTKAHKEGKAPPAVIWLKAARSDLAPPAAPGNFTLIQKDKMFTPHLLVVPAGSSVAFPNADPFFHNVFSLFEGKRFDLGLYEAGSTRSVIFSREGVSYIFCNIHSEMSAVVIALTTPFYSIDDAHGAFNIAAVPDGDYELHVWIEGQHQSSLDQQTRRVHIGGDAVDLGDIHFGSSDPDAHRNKFGRPYEPQVQPPY